MAPRGRGRAGHNGGIRGRGRGRGGGGARGASVRRRGGSARQRNGFASSRTQEAEDASNDEQTDSEDEQQQIKSDEPEAQSASEDEADPRQSYNSLLRVLNAKKSVDEKPSKRRKIERTASPEAETSAPEDLEPLTTDPDIDDAGAALTEAIDDDDAEDAPSDGLSRDSDDEELLFSDPFEKHYTTVNEGALNTAISALKEKNKQTRTIVNDRLKRQTTAYNEKPDESGFTASQKDLHLKRRLLSGGSRVYELLTSAEKDVARNIFAYRDIQCGMRTTQNAPRLRDIASLHAMNHIFKTRDRVLKNNAKASQHDNADALDLRDQGFTRPKVLVIVPTKQACARFVDSIAKISEPDQQENKSRFLDTFSASDDESWENKPDDFKELFGGNHEEDFRVGLKFTRKTIKYFSGFYNSDIIFGSALGLMRTITTGGGSSKDQKKSHDADFLSSIEVVIVDHVSAIQMQNWQHLEYVFNQLNLLPKDSHGCDFSRVREWYLDGNAKYLRQTILLTAYHTPEINSLISTQATNTSGLVKYTPTYPGAMLSLPATISTIPPQTFLRFSSPNPHSDPATRFTYFTTTILPPLLRHRHSNSGTLLFIPTYADFTRLRNHLSTSPTTSNLSFGTISEYTAPKDVARARSHFQSARHSLLIYSERAHHHFRYRLRGVRRIIFYGLPDNPTFWPEMLAMLDQQQNTENPGAKASVKALFSRWDVLKLERIVGTDRVGRMIVEKGGDVFEFV